ncbi:amino-acid acetyltransferase, mitochondrial [[Candida] railenensis]|uniref:Amino-acid acetyltransferase, mitochondrial n=1 Tax=[Candida] railenensis TaxID=45579 RepID=A0A9P0VW33_9ASCO|nr:amino-acid acetyltransferase, mitochondrial [[Candida] railenensis]
MSKLRNLNRQFISNLKTHEVVTDAKRNLILSILKSTTTKREARNYLEKYQSQFDFSDITFGNKPKQSTSLERRDSQRELFINRYLNKQNPFVGIYEDEAKVDKIPLRLAILKIKFTTISVPNWLGIAETLKRLVHLGISPIIILDYDHLPRENFKNVELFTIEQASKVVQYISRAASSSSSSSSSPSDDTLDSTLQASVTRSLFTKAKEGGLDMMSIEQILIPLYQGIIPIIQPIVYNPSTTYQDIVDTDEILYTLCSSLLDTNSLLSIEKIIMIDPTGGIPSIERQHSSHVFINLSQEYSDIVSELYIGHIHPTKRDLHLKNLKTMNKILQLCFAKSGNDDATGIITTPDIMAINNDQLNPIIYNVLTDRPVISSSLPSSRQLTPQLSTSILKKGMDVNIIDESSYPHRFTLNNLIRDNVIDQERLVGLLNDSFGKQLISDEYFKRINSNIKSIIIIGDYDGAAIITWEEHSKGHESAPEVTTAIAGNNKKGKIAYLDKFAIAKRNQGLPGLADVVFKQVLQNSPQELIWRSRKVNPVNKWYFERCVGCTSSPESQWKIFYTGDIFNKRITKSNGFYKAHDRIDISKKLEVYSDICEQIVPSFQK